MKQDTIIRSAYQLDGRLSRLYSCVHRKDLVISEQRSDEGAVGAHLVAVEGSGGQSKRLRLLLKGLDDPGMAMALINCAVGRKEVQVLFALNVPHVHALGPVDHHWDGAVVVGTLLELQRDG